MIHRRMFLFFCNYGNLCVSLPPVIPINLILLGIIIAAYGFVCFSKTCNFLGREASQTWPTSRKVTTCFNGSYMRKGNALRRIYLQGSAFKVATVLGMYWYSLDCHTIGDYQSWHAVVSKTHLHFNVAFNGRASQMEQVDLK